jgi:hypothetical protein
MISACKKDPVVIDDIPTGGKINFVFSHQVDGLPVIYDTTMYTNAAGNVYQVNEVKYFISDVTLHKTGGTKVVLKGNNEIHYFDKDYPSTLNWLADQVIPVGSYDSVSFTFGISASKNKSNMFVNAPEMNMFWPSYMGGGYHYMMLNMKWLDLNNVLTGNAFHLGIGQIYDTTGNITGFIHNNFSVRLPSSAFTIALNKTTNIPVIMNIENWFQNPNVFDFDVWGGDIMQNQPAMSAAAANGHDVFSTGAITQN